MNKRVLAPLHVAVLLVLWIAPALFAQSEDYRKAQASHGDRRYLEALVWIQQAVAAEDDKASYYLLSKRDLQRSASVQRRRGFVAPSG